jgi:DNA polymerase/3'-5' exonuclease PolX
MFSEKLIDEKIREAIEKGEFDDLPGKGKPLDLEAYFATPEDLRLGYSVLKSAGCLPVEVELQNEIESLKSQLAACDDERRRRDLGAEIESKTLKLNLLMDGNQRARRGGKG